MFNLYQYIILSSTFNVLRQFSQFKMCMVKTIQVKGSIVFLFKPVNQ